jgi:hypothetical protein
MWFKIKDTVDKRPAIMQIMRDLEAEYKVNQSFKEEGMTKKEGSVDEAVAVDTDDDEVMST